MQILNVLERSDILVYHALFANITSSRLESLPSKLLLVKIFNNMVALYVFLLHF